MARTWPNAAANRLKVGSNPSALAFPGNASKFTLAGWVKLNNVGATEQVFMSKYDGSFGPLFRTLSGKVRMFWIDTGSSGHEAIGATTMSTGTWYHIAATWPRATSPGMQVWLNGVVDGADTTNATMNATSDSTNGWTFGARAAATFPLDGDMCEMCMFNDVLTADQILALARCGSPHEVAPGLLVGYWPTFGSYDNQADFSQQSNNLQLVGTLATADHAPVGPQVPIWSPYLRTFVSAGTSPPVNTVAPAVTPTWTEVGRVESCSTGTWTGSPTPTYTYQWQHSADGSTGWADIGSATAATYTVALTYLTEYLRCIVTASNADAGSPVSANSNVVGPVTGSPAAGYASVAVS